MKMLPFLLLACIGLSINSTFSATEPPRIDVILWFDTEDFILPADDDACKRLAELLTARHVRATFKVVGEKARVLEKRGRRDVISALKKHDIAYHTDFHSVHPTPTEYLADCGWLDGIAEFIRREGAGAKDVRRIFSVRTLSCYGQPGSSWAPQAIGALPQIGVAPHGIPCYVDEGNHIGLNHQPFWYVGALNVYDIGPNCTRMELHNPDAVEPAKKAVSALAEKLRSQPNALISIYYHPCEWVHKQFWDGVNFSRGANPPREQWQLPPQRTKEETDGAFDRFAQYIDHICSIPGVRWITARDLPKIYPDLVRTKGATEQDLAAIAKSILAAGGKGIDYQVIDNRAYSVADQFELLTVRFSELLRRAGAIKIYQSRLTDPLPAKGLLGPDSPAGNTTTPQHINWFAFRDTTKDVLAYIQTQQRIPARVFIGADAIDPADFLSALAFAYDYYCKNRKLPVDEEIALGTRIVLLPANHVAKDTPGLYGGWVIHKAGFSAPKVLEQARLQAWTLKPALKQAE